MEMSQDSLPQLKVCMLLPYHYEPNMLVYSRVKIFSYITHFGHQVTWVISSPKADRIQQFSLDGIVVYAIPYRRYFPGSSVLAKVFNRIPYALRKMRFALKIFREGKYDIIYARDNVFDGLVAAHIKRVYKALFVFELANPLEQGWEEMRLGPMKPTLFYYLLAKFNKFTVTHLLHKADLVLPVSKWLKEHLVTEGIEESKIVAVPVGVDIGVFSSRDGKRIAEIYHLDNSKVVIYEGTLGKERYLNVLLQAFSKVKKERENVKLLVVGDGNDAENLKKFANELGIKDDVIFTGQVPQSEVPDFIAAGDIGVSPIPPHIFSYKVSSPIKMVEYMAAAKPVVANEEIPEHKEVLEQSGGGMLVPFTPEAFAEAIIELLDSPKQAVEMGQKGREWVIKNRSYEILARQVEKRYLELIQGKEFNSG